MLKKLIMQKNDTIDLKNLSDLLHHNLVRDTTEYKLPLLFSGINVQCIVIAKILSLLAVQFGLI